MSRPGRAGLVAARAALVLALVVLAIPSPAAAIWPFSSPSQERAPARPAPAPDPPSSITAPEVARRAEETSRTLRDIDALITPGAGVVAIRERLPEIAGRVAAETESANRELDGGPSSAGLEALQAQWQMLRAELSTYVNVLAERGITLERSLETLTRLRETWSRARTDVRASRAPEQVVGRIDGILTTIGEGRGRLSQERAATLVLQDQVAQLIAECDDMLGRVGTARTDMAGRLLARDGVPIWRPGRLAEAVLGLRRHAGEAASSAVGDMRQFVEQRQGRIYVNAAVVVALALLTFVARRTARGLAPALDARAVRALDHPLAAALLLLFLASAFSPPRSRVPQALIELVILVPAWLVIRAVIEERRVSALYWLGAPVLADIVRRLASTVPPLEQDLFLLEALGVVLLAGWKLRVHLRSPAPDVPERWHRVLPFALGGVVLAFVAAGVAAAAGYVRLGIFIGSGILGTAFIALVVYAAVTVVGALVAVSLRVRPLRDLRVVPRHRPLIERRLRTALRWVAAGAWVILVLRHFGLLSPATHLAEAVLDARWHLGTLTVPVAGLLVFVVTVLATFMISALVRFLLQEEIYPRVAPERALPYAVSTLVHYGLVLAGFLLGLAALGVDLTKITIVAGALGVGVGFGLQNLVNNFVSGLVVLSERRINVGDSVQIGDVGGVVQQLGIRACTVRTWEGAEVIVPNASLVTEKVANWTLSDQLRRVDVPVGVAYGTAAEKVTEVMLGVARGHACVLTSPEAIVVFRGFGDSVLRFELRCWTDRFDRWFLTQSELAVASYAALQEAGIEIPFPQYEVRLRRG
jgi:small-conductance mechanosensitive channel